MVKKLSPGPSSIDTMFEEDVGRLVAKQDIVILFYCGRSRQNVIHVLKEDSILYNCKGLLYMNNTISQDTASMRQPKPTDTSKSVPVFIGLAQKFSPSLDITKPKMRYVRFLTRHWYAICERKN